MSGHFYQLFGLRVVSEMALPELFEADAGPADVTIGFGRLDPDCGGEPAISASAGEMVMRVAGVARYRVRGGSEIAVEPVPGTAARNIRLYLLGSVFGAILHQRGLLPLHANAVELEGRAVAFLGHSGAGKSTLAAWFHDRGYRILADDVCVVSFDEAGRPLAHGGVPRLRLWRDALERGGRDAEDFELSYEDWEKYDVPTTAVPASAPLPLSHIYLLRKAPEGAGGVAVRLDGVAAVEALMTNTYRGAYLRLMGQAERHLRDSLRLAQTVPVFRADRRWGIEAFDAEAGLLERHARDLLRSPEHGCAAEPIH